MRTRRKCAALLLLALIAGCGTIETAPPAGSDAVSRSEEQGGRFIALVGPQRQHAEPFLGVPGTNFYALRSWIDRRTGESANQLYVEDSYFGAERNFDSARTGSGEPLKFVPIAKNEITCEQSCSYAEEFAAALPESMLRASRDGLTVTFTGKSGAQMTVAVPGELVQKQLAALDAAHGGTPPVAVGAPPAAR